MGLCGPRSRCREDPAVWFVIPGMVDTGIACLLSVPMRLAFPLLLAELALTCLCPHYAASSYMKYRWVQRSFPMNGFVKKCLATLTVRLQLN